MNTKNIITAIGAVIIIGLLAYGAMNATPAVAPSDDMSQGKLDITVVCESALSYMTFTDGAAAEQFVSECKEGKHPEVIEQYKSQMGLGEGTEI